MPSLAEPNGTHPAGRKAWLRWALLCDEVRTEDNGKHFIIGAYRKAVVLNTRPALLSLRLTGAFEFVSHGEHKLEFRVTTPGGQGLGAIQSLPDAEPGTYADFNVPLVDFLHSDGVIQLDWRVDGDDWGPPMTWQIAFSPDATDVSEDQASAMADVWNSTVAVHSAG